VKSYSGVQIEVLLNAMLHKHGWYFAVAGTFQQHASYATKKSKDLIQIIQ
jgi:hypothetical protein